MQIYSDTQSLSTVSLPHQERRPTINQSLVETPHIIVFHSVFNIKHVCSRPQYLLQEGFILMMIVTTIATIIMTNPMIPIVRRR